MLVDVILASSQIEKDECVPGLCRLVRGLTLCLFNRFRGLVISQDFLISEFITNNELPLLLDKAASEGLKILWIAVRASTVEDSYPQITKYQAVHKEPPLAEVEEALRDKHFKEIYTKIKEAVAA